MSGVMLLLFSHVLSRSLACGLKVASDAEGNSKSRHLC
jgi:hypothetical protein